MVKQKPLSGANVIPLGYQKPSFTGANAIPVESRHRRISVFNRIEFPPRSSSARNSSKFPNLNSKAQALFCIRCLSSGHRRVNCKRPIRCNACLGWGHVAASCYGPKEDSQRQDISGERQDISGGNGRAASTSNPGFQAKGKGKAEVPINSGRFTVVTDMPSTSKPPIFNSFAEMSRACFPSWATKETALAFTVPWSLRPTRAAPSSTVQALDPLSWTLHVPSYSSSCLASSSAAPVPSVNSLPDPRASDLLASSFFSSCDHGVPARSSRTTCNSKKSPTRSS